MSVYRPGPGRAAVVTLSCERAGRRTTSVRVSGERACVDVYAVADVILHSIPLCALTLPSLPAGTLPTAFVAR